MTENIKESLSAWIDGEASEIEVHRLLRQFDEDQSLRPSWARYVKVRAVIRRERHLASKDHLALQQRISAAILLEPALGAEPALPKHRSERRYLAPVASLAVAASLVAAVFVGINMQSAPEPSSVATAAEPLPAIAAQPASSRPDMAAAFEPASDESGLRELDEDQQRRLRAYLNQHDQMVRMNPNVRTVVFDKQGEK